MFELEAFPTPTDVFAPAPDSDASAPPENASARAAAIRRSEADRKREERAKRRAHGIPDPRRVDASIISAIVGASARRGHPQTIAKTKSLGGLSITLQDVLVGALADLVETRGIGQPQAKRAVLVRLGLGR